MADQGAAEAALRCQLELPGKVAVLAPWSGFC